MPDYSSLCCPKCRGALDQGPSLRCRACGTDYPIQAGVPVMLPSVNGHGHQDGQDVPNEKAFYETMFSDLKGPSDGYCIVYGYEPVYRAVEKLDRGSILEPGCGTGHYSVNFTKMGFSVTAGCPPKRTRPSAPRVERTVAVLRRRGSTRMKM